MFHRLPRRLQFVLALTLVVLGALFFLGTSNTHDFDPYLDKVPKIGAQLQHGVHHAVEVAQNVVDNVPSFLGPSAHSPPPEQANSTSGEAKWYSDWKWLSPFSDSVTFDEERAVLPPLRPRPPVYTYFDPGSRRKDEKSKKAEHDILMVWRRAWWAAGFKPVILTSAEATHNPLYKGLQGLELQPELRTELMRWLAWSNMGTGVLVHWLAFPMARYDDPMLTFLRHGEYPELLQYEDTGNGVFVGSRERIDAAIKEALASRAIPSVKSMYEAVSHEHLKLMPAAEAIALYSFEAMRRKYVPIRKLLDDPETVGDAMEMLPDLINSHLHANWLASYPKGIAVLKPMPESASILIEPAMAIAKNLTYCPPSPIPLSCPPNRARCVECASDHHPILTPASYKNDTKLFTIGTLPHPYTTTSLVKNVDSMDVGFIRRECKRDMWIAALTKDLLGKDRSSLARLTALKDAVAGPDGAARSIWLTAERPFQRDSSHVLDDLDWLVGFRIRREPALAAEASNSKIPGRRVKQKSKGPLGDGPKLSEEQLASQRSLLAKARDLFGPTKPTAPKKKTFGADNGAAQPPDEPRPFARTRRMLEGWNLADTEAWKFVRAYNARERVERESWEQQEEAFLGKGAYDRWLERILS